MTFKFLTNQSISRKIWILVGILSGLTVVAIGAGLYLAENTQTIGLQALEETMLVNHKDKLLALVEAQRDQINLIVKKNSEEDEQLKLIRETLVNATFHVTSKETQKTGYFFLFNVDGTCIAHPTSPEKDGKNFWDATDPDGKKYFQDFAKAAKNGGEYVKYSIKKPGQQVAQNKLSYVAPIAGTEWYIGTGVYIDDIKEHRERIHDQLETAKAKSLMFAFFVIGAYALFIVTPFTLILIRKSIVGPIRQVVDALSDIASGEGDLTKRIPVKTNDEVGQLAKGFNTFAQKIHDTIAQVSNSAQDVASAATEIAAASDEMANGLQQQSSQVHQISSAIEEMNASIVEVAHKSEDAAKQAIKSGDVAEEGGTIVNQTVHEMQSIKETVNASAVSVQELGKRGEQIGQIIAVINDIADQTNLLALNAAIEAARAGEHGRGFAVVADEVRKLADRTTKATGEIAQSITAIQDETKLAVDRMSEGTDQVSQGVEKASIAGESLSEIVNSVRAVSDMIQSIAAAADQQSTASTQVANNIENISSVTRQTSQGAEQAAEASGQLSAKAEQLQSLVKQFKIDHQLVKR